MSKKKREAGPAAEAGRLILEVESPDESVRGDAVRALCPCHAGWELFERHVGVVLRACRDRSRVVRAHALHVFEDAARMQHMGEVDYLVQDAEARMRKKRASRFRPGEAAPSSRRREEVWKLRRHRRGAGDEGV
jgi:hypothetical protein